MQYLKPKHVLYTRNSALKLITKSVPTQLFSLVFYFDVFFFLMETTTEKKFKAFNEKLKTQLLKYSVSKINQYLSKVISAQHYPQSQYQKN